jgi:uncharacterized ferritin-like protein (DUF455 family)
MDGMSFDKTSIISSIPEPGRPDKPILVPPLEVPKRGIGTKVGHAGLFHALAHIEFNAINLALDACYRFQNMPLEYYKNWMSVAKDEVYHFGLLNQHLSTLGYTYGDFTAHTGLWDMVYKTESDVLLRMALVPRVLEARGIDAVPELQKKITHIKDTRGAEILAIIHHDEITHVKYGDIWFKYICDERKLDYTDTFFTILDKYAAPKIRGAFNRPGRKLAGFSDLELDKLLLR